MNNLETNIYRKSQIGERYFIIKNKDGKKWLLEKSNIITSLALYQSSSLKGDLIKKTIPFLSLFDTTKIYIDKGFDCFISSYFDCKCKLSFSFFEGTPGIHQKMVFQVSYKDKIFGYGKISDKSEIYDLFLNEKNNLDFLNKLNIGCIPQIIFCGKYDNKYLLLQTTDKTVKYLNVKKMKKNHYDFLNSLYLNTRVKKNFFKTVFYKNLNNISLVFQKYEREKNNRDLSNYIGVLLKKIDFICSYFENEKETYWYFCHRDFTPWNSFINNNKLFVFDWEYSTREYPPLIDFFHFFVQTKKLIKKQKYKVILNDYANARNVLLHEFSSLNLTIEKIDLFFACYLVDIIGLYVLRDGIDKFEKNIDNYIVWFQLLKEL